MATKVQIRGASAAVLAAATPAERELGVVTDDHHLVVGDGVTLGGVPHATQAWTTAQINATANGVATNLLLFASCL